MVFLNKSVNQKLYALVGLALLGAMLIALTSIAFFGKISQIGSINQVGYRYEVMLYQSLADMNEFMMTGDADLFKKINAKLEKCNRTDGAIGIFHRLLEQGKSVDETVASYEQEFGHAATNKPMVKILKSLEGKSLRENLVRTTDAANINTRKWIDLLNQYAREKDTQRKEALIAQIRSIAAELPPLLSNFQEALNGVADHLKAFVKKLFLLLCLIISALLAVTAHFINRSISGPLKKTAEFAKAMSDGDFRKELKINNKDELGQMADALNSMTLSLRTMLSEVIDGINTINASSTELSTISEHLSQGAQDASVKSNGVQASAEKMSTSMAGIAAAMEESSTNANMVASSAEEMSSTISEISQNAEKARGISSEAAGQASVASSRMNELGQAAQSIGKVVETITDISEQVNLLALNATIEAARAGEAGKGFAVVANEIKELARQTATATEDIRARIEGIQGTTTDTVSQMGMITNVINQINDLVGGIALAVEEQSGATREIATNISQASSGVQEVNENVNQSSVMAKYILEEIADVERTAGEISSSSNQVNMSAMDLSRLSEQLKSTVDRFFTV